MAMKFFTAPPSLGGGSQPSGRPAYVDAQDVKSILSHKDNAAIDSKINTGTIGTAV
jgi:hypothetical protein